MAITVRHPPDINLRDLNNRVFYHRSQDGFNSDPPDVVLDYTGCTSRRTAYSGVKPGYVVAAGKSQGSSYYFHQAAGKPYAETFVRNAAYDDLKERAVGQTSSLGTLLAEWRQGMGLIGQALDVASTSVNLLRRDMHRLRLNRNDMSARQTYQRASKSWLNFWFGWSPAVNDIWSSIETLEKPLGYGEPVYGSSSNTTAGKLATSGTYKGSEYTRTYHCKQGAIFTLSNPNVALAAQLGLINPVEIAWNAARWTFLIDWAFDVSSWIGSFSDFAGVTVSKAYTTFYQHSYDNWKYSKGGLNLVNIGSCTIEGFDHIRTGGLTRPIPNFNVSANLGKSITRAASAASLLTLALTSGGEPPYRTFQN